MKIICSKIKKKIARFMSKIINTEDRRDYLKYHDPLTNFPNRKKLIDLFNESVALSEQEERVIIVANIDRLHSINELYGREIGDQAIIKLIKRLKKAFKNETTVFKEDHFYLYLEGVSVNELDELGQKVQDIMTEPFKIGEINFQVTVSIGMSHYPSTGDNIHTLLHQAEIAMSKVKKDGKNNYGVTLQEDIRKNERKRKLEFDLKEALNREELYLAYQPEVCIETGEIRAAEALIRWEHPELGNITPTEFIPIAEKTAMMNQIGKWVVREGVTEAKKWHEQGLKIGLAVNVSYVQFKDKLLVQDILSILEAIDMIKIERAFIEGLPGDEKAIQMVKMIIQIAKNLGSTIVAEGVEELEALAYN